MEFKKLPISFLVPATYNPRKDLQPGDPEFERIRRSIEEFGYVDPVIVNSDMTIIGGHQRVKVLSALGHTEIDCVIVEVDKTKEKALNIALNKISGEWDEEKLAELIEELKITPNALRRMVVSGQIPCTKVGKKYLIDLDVLFEYLKGTRPEQVLPGYKNPFGSTRV